MQYLVEFFTSPSYTTPIATSQLYDKAFSIENVPISLWYRIVSVPDSDPIKYSAYYQVPQDQSIIVIPQYLTLDWNTDIVVSEDTR